MNLIDKIEESKRHTTILNNLIINFEYLKNLAPQLLNDKVNNKENNFADACSILHKLCDDIESGIKDLKQIIPNHINDDQKVINL